MLRLLIFVFIKYAFVSCGEQADENVHLKIIVPEFINHHHHTKIVYIHEKPQTHHHKPPAGKDHKDQGHKSHKYHDQLNGFYPIHGPEITVEPKSPLIVTGPGYEKFTTPSLDTNNHNGINSYGQPLTYFPNNQNYNNQLNIPQVDTAYNFYPGKPQNLENKYESEYNKAVSNFENNFKSDYGGNLEKDKGFGKLADGLKTTVNYFPQQQNVPLYSPDEAIKQTHQKVKSHQNEFKSLHIPNSAYDVYPPATTYTYSNNNYKSEVKDTYEKNPKSHHSYFFPGIPDETKEEIKDDNYDKLEDLSYDLHSSNYHKYFPDSHEKLIRESEIKNGNPSVDFQGYNNNYFGDSYGHYGNPGSNQNYQSELKYSQNAFDDVDHRDVNDVDNYSYNVDSGLDEGTF